jgi:uncharacterized protein with HEPN domain
MSRDDWVYVSHMLEMSQKALDILSGKDRTAYEQDEVMRLALTHLVQMIGEAANHVSENFREVYPQIPWFEIVGMRHRIVHDYLNVDEDIIWEVVRQDLPGLVTVLKGIVPPEMQE